jgi:hypothetical protein
VSSSQQLYTRVDAKLHTLVAERLRATCSSLRRASQNRFGRVRGSSSAFRAWFHDAASAKLGYAGIWYRGRDLNPQPARCRRAALPLSYLGRVVPSAGHDPATSPLRAACAAYLRHDGLLVPRAGHDPARFRLKGGCSARLSYRGSGVVGESRTLMTSRPPGFEPGASAVPPRRQIVGRAGDDLAPRV